MAPRQENEDRPSMTDTAALDTRAWVDHWDRLGEGWDKWADRLAQQAEGLNQPLIAAAGVGAGDRVLDLASGTGEPALSLAKVVGAQGRVVATDPAPRMLAGLRRRAEQAGLGNLSVEAAEMQDLPFADASFDRVTCRFGIMFVPDAARAFAEVRRVLRPGGSAAFMVWGPQSDNAVLGTVIAWGVRRFGTSDAARYEAPFGYGAAGRLADAMQAGGLQATEERELRFTPEVDAAVPFWRPPLGMTFGPEMEQLAEAERHAADADLKAAFAAFLDGGVYRLPMHVRIGIGHAGS